MTIAAKMVFSENVKYTSRDVYSNKFIIYYDKNGEPKKCELPLDLINEFIYIDQEKLVKCPICESTNIISEKISIDETINNIINDIENPQYEDDPIPDKNWECLNCGSTKELLDRSNTVSTVQRKLNDYSDPVDTEQRKVKNRMVDTVQRVVKDRCNGDLPNFDDESGFGKLSHLQIQGKRYLKSLHWFRMPFRLLRLLKNHGDAFLKTPPYFKWTEKDRYLYLEYLWYLDKKDHPIPDNIDLTRVCDDRYMRPPRLFNREYLKYKYPDIWTKIDAKFEWKVSGNYVTLKIYWDKQKYELRCLQDQRNL